MLLCHERAEPDLNVYLLSWMVFHGWVAGSLSVNQYVICSGHFERLGNVCIYSSWK